MLMTGFIFPIKNNIFPKAIFEEFLMSGLSFEDDFKKINDFLPWDLLWENLHKTR